MQYASYIRLKNPYDISHHGTKGMHWGIRRYQNEDGTLTELGKKRMTSKYNRYSSRANKYLKKESDIRSGLDKKNEKLIKSARKLNQYTSKKYELEAKNKNLVYKKKKSEDKIEKYEKKVDDGGGKYSQFKYKRALLSDKKNAKELAQNSKAQYKVDLKVSRYANETKKWEVEIKNIEVKSAEYKLKYNKIMSKMEKNSLLMSLPEAKEKVSSWEKRESKTIDISKYYDNSNKSDNNNGNNKNKKKK